ncbi:MAG: phosphoribosyltransferase [Candidatus Dormibacteria bacterium]
MSAQARPVQMEAPVLDVPSTPSVFQPTFWAERRSPAAFNVRPIASADRIQERVAAIAAEIARQHRFTPVTLVVVMRGGFVFAVDLIRQLWEHDVEVLGMEFFQSTSYVGDKPSSEPVISALGRVNLPDEGPVLIVDDIVDAGKTISAMLGRLAAPNRTLEICALLDRPEGRALPVYPRYVGFRLNGPGFVVGYGLDHDSRHRELPYLAQWLVPPPEGPSPSA